MVDIYGNIHIKCCYYYIQKKYHHHHHRHHHHRNGNVKYIDHKKKQNKTMMKIIKEKTDLWMNGDKNKKFLHILSFIIFFFFVSIANENVNHDFFFILIKLQDVWIGLYFFWWWWSVSNCQEKKNEMK